MQIDMHYYGVYALARLAGLKPEAAKIIAMASQYVDDSVGSDTLDHESGGKLIPVATAHHTTSIRNIDRDDQRYIWMPFHFLPGNVGTSLTERLVCRENSALAKAMRDHHLAFFDEPFALELMGVAAHVYADTFAHAGFSGVSSRRNKVRSDDIKILGVTDKTRKFWEKEIPKFFSKYGTVWENIKRTISSSGAELISGALGHGAVLTFPDQPYLHWHFVYEERGDDYKDRPGQEYDRENQKHYLNACRELYDMFKKFGKSRKDFSDDQGPVDFDGKMQDHIKGILTVEEGKTGRSAAWIQAVKDGKLYAGEEIPPYDQKSWDRARDGFPGLEDEARAVEYPVYRFFQAASLHRHYVLRELLPANRLVVA